MAEDASNQKITEVIAPPGFEADILKAQHLEELAQHNPTALIHLILTYEKIAKRLQPDENSDFYAAIHYQLGKAYDKRPSDNLAADMTDAIVCYQKALQVWMPENNRPQYVHIHILLGNAYFVLSTVDQRFHFARGMAIICLQEAIRAWEPGLSHRDYIFAHTSLGNVYRESSGEDDQLKAMNSYKAALHHLKLEENPWLYAHIQTMLGEIYRKSLVRDRGKLHLAIACYQEALRVWSPETTPEEYMKTQWGLGDAYQGLPTEEKLPLAILCYKEALRVWNRETMSVDDYVGIWINLGLTYFRLPVGNRVDNLNQAIACYQKALSFCLPDTEPYARIQTLLGDVHGSLPVGDPAENMERALAYYLEALHFYTPETAPLTYAQIQANLGATYADTAVGNHQINLKQAIACYEEALRFLTHENDPSTYIWVMTSLGGALRGLLTGTRYHNLLRALQCYEEVLRVVTPETSPRDYARAQRAMGSLYNMLPGDPISHLRQATKCYQEALHIWTPESAPHDHAVTQVDLGANYRDLARLEEDPAERTHTQSLAAACYEKALHFLTPETDPHMYTLLQMGRGTLYRDMATDESMRIAIDCYQKALRSQPPDIDLDRRIHINGALAEIYAEQGDWAAALATYHAALDASEQLYRAGLFAAEKAVAMATRATLAHNAALAAVRCEKVAEALVLLELGKAQVLAEALQSSVQKMDLPALAKLLPDERTALVVFSITATGSLVFVVSHRQELQIQAVEIPDFKQETLLQLFGRTDIRSITLLPGEDHIKTEHDLIRSFLKKESTIVFNDGWVGAHKAWKRQGDEQALERMTQTLAALGRDLLAPILAHIPAGVKRLIFVPSRQLFLLPLHAAPLSDNVPDRVCDQYQVSYAPSLQVLIHLQAKAAKEVIPDIYAVINPQANDSRTNLPFTWIEKSEIARHFTRYTLDEGEAATYQRVTKNVGGRTYVHFACHGTYSWQDPSASALHLADQSLTLAELQQGTIDVSTARLVTLSACETGLSDMVEGSPDEYVGLPAGFMLAGVPCVVSSLWEVPDISTAIMMGRFYHNHLRSQMEFTAALYEAQSWIRDMEVREVVKYIEQCMQQADWRKKDELNRLLLYYRSQEKQNPALRPFAHPFYWAAFTVNGL